MPYGDQQPYELLIDDAAWRDEPRRIAAELGHDPYWDPGTQERWTCRTCGRAIIRVGCNIYGTAGQIRCGETEEQPA